ncbi:MAG: CHAD domain-containing protein [Alphaproteobacteria bacterium]
MAASGKEREVELALRVAQADLPVLLASPVLARLRAGPDRVRRLVSSYHDTPDFALRAAGAVLRIRGTGRRRVQTLKTASRAGDAAISRGEWEAAIAGTRPDLSLLPAGALPDELAPDGELGERLVPVFETDFRRRAIPLRLGGSLLELAIDEGEIRAGAAREAIREIEVELREGEVADLFAVVARLREVVPLSLQVLPKSARAHLLLSGHPPAPMRATRPRLGRHAAVGPAFATIARNCLAQLRANAAAIERGDDPEGIHQFRVALRRLRSAFSVFAGAMPAATRRRMAAALRRLARRCDPARELDVFLGEMLPAVRGRMGHQPGLDAVEAAGRRALGLARARVRAMLEGPGFAEAILPLEAWIEGGGWRAEAGDGFDMPARDLARQVLKRLHRKLLRDGRGIGHMPVAELHALRLRAKKLRYAAEFFRDLFPGRGARRQVEALAAVQGLLGTINDGDSTRALLARLSRGRAGRDLAMQGGVALVLGWCAAREAACIERLPGPWEEFAGTRPFWK